MSIDSFMVKLQVYYSHIHGSDVHFEFSSPFVCNEPF
uniref:Uncharacterized protein n=1 Tax=Rhizophora mucronata TaxID=61149 RepID=A0A2P2NF18_RHIMU